MWAEQNNNNNNNNNKEARVCSQAVGPGDSDPPATPRRVPWAGRNSSHRMTPISESELEISKLCRASQAGS